MGAVASRANMATELFQASNALAALGLAVATGADPAAIVEAKGLRQVTDAGAIDSAIDEVLAAHIDKVAEYRAGRDKLYGFFVGQVMRATQGKANPALVNRLLKEKLSG